MKTIKKKNSIQLVSFYLSGHLYGLDIHVVKEVNPTTDIAPVPLSRECFKGLVNIRGQIVLIIDLAIILGRQPACISEESQLVILKTASEIANVKTLFRAYEARHFGDKPVALLVDRIGDVLDTSESTVEKAPAHLSEKAVSMVECMVRIENAVLTVLNPEAILSSF